MLIASVSLPPEGLALEHTVDAVPEVEIEAERIAAHSTEWVMPCLWVAHPEFDRIRDAFEADPAIDDIVQSSTYDDEAYYQVEWSEQIIRRINSYINKEGSILEARLHNGRWTVDLRFANREQFDAFRDELADQGHTFELLSLLETESPHQGFQYLTSTQRDALVTAVEQGYFRVPRESTTDELADELDISHQAVSELLRRGTENLVLSTLTVEGP